MVALKDLVVSIAGNFIVRIYKSLVKRKDVCFVRESMVNIFKNIMKSFGLLLVITKEMIGDLIFRVLV